MCVIKTQRGLTRGRCSVIESQNTYKEEEKQLYKVVLCLSLSSPLLLSPSLPSPPLSYMGALLLSLKFSLIVKHFSETHLTIAYESHSWSSPTAFDELSDPRPLSQAHLRHENLHCIFAPPAHPNTVF